jgi:hypothetical protein
MANLRLSKVLIILSKVVGGYFFLQIKKYHLLTLYWKIDVLALCKEFCQFSNGPKHIRLDVFISYRLGHMVPFFYFIMETLLDLVNVCMLP